MVLVVRLLSEPLTTLFALEGSNVIMYHYVVVHVGAAQELLAAVRAVVQLALSLRAIDHLERYYWSNWDFGAVGRVLYDDLAPFASLLFFFVFDGGLFRKDRWRGL